MVQNTVFVSHGPLEKFIVSVLEKMRHNRNALITELCMNSTTDESIYALTVGCCGESPRGTGGVQYS